MTHDAYKPRIPYWIYIYRHTYIHIYIYIYIYIYILEPFSQHFPNISGYVWGSSLDTQFLEITIHHPRRKLTWPSHGGRTRTRWGCSHRWFHHHSHPEASAIRHGNPPRSVGAIWFPRYSKIMHTLYILYNHIFIQLYTTVFWDRIEKSKNEITSQVLKKAFCSLSVSVPERPAQKVCLRTSSPERFPGREWKSPHVYG